MQFSALLILGATSLFLSNAAIAQQVLPASTGKAELKNLVAMNALSVSNKAGVAATTVAPLEAKEFKGMVVDELGEPLAGAVVSVVVDKNQFSVTTTTNAAGEYAISSTIVAPILLVTYAGCTEIQQKAVYGHPITFQMEFINNYERKLKRQGKTAEKVWRK